MTVLMQPGQWLCDPTLWFITGFLILGLCMMVLDALDHGIYVGVPAILVSFLLGFSPWFQHPVGAIGAYGLMVALFYLLCYRHFRDARKKQWDPNATPDDEDM